MTDVILFHHACGRGVPASTFGTSWPDVVALQLHLTEGDEWSETDVAQDLANEAKDGELFTYPGTAHLIADSSLSEYDPTAAASILRRTIEFLDHLQ